MNAGLLDLLIQICIYAIVTLGLDFVVGYARIFAVNQGLMFGIGAFSYVAVNQLFHSTDLLLSWLIAVTAAVVTSALIGFASLWVRGDAFIVVSFGAQMVGIQAIYNIAPISGGSAGAYGLPRPELFGWTPLSLTDYLILVVIVGVVVYLFGIAVVRSPWGRLLRAVGEDEVAVAAGGFDSRRLKVMAFVLSGALAAIAGSLFSGYLGIAQTNDFSLDLSISLVAMIVLGGAGRVLGGLVGAIIYVGLPYVLDLAQLPASLTGFLQQGIFGAALLVVVFYRPNGIVGGVSSFFTRKSSGQALAVGGTARRDQKGGAA